MVDVISMNGRITRGDSPDVGSWASKEDGEHFRNMLQAYPVIIMGRATYDAMQPRPESGRLRLVLTRKPSAYQHVQTAGQLEFTDMLPATIVKDLEEKGHKSALLAGGGEVNAAFLAAGLVTDIYLTIEPRIFSNGTDVVSSHYPVDVVCQLITIEKLNDSGTLLAHYRTEAA